MSSGVEVITTKLSPPELRSSDIERVQLLNWVNRQRRPRLVVMRAPAGYGKSVLAAQLVRIWGMPTAWYRMGRDDDDSRVFAKHLVAGVCGYLPLLRTIEAADNDLEEFERDPQRLVPLLANQFGSALLPHIAIVLENCHHVRDQELQSLLAELIANAPRSCTFVLTSRDHIPIDVSRYAASREAVLLGANDLRFAESEIEAMLSKEGRAVDSGLAARICAETEGWPALVQLMVSEENAEDTALSGLSQTVYDYLESEVLAKVDESLCTFMRTTSILDFLTPELCDAYLEVNDSAETLKLLRQAQLIVPSGSGQPPSYRYLRPLRQCLLDAVGAERQALMVRAASCEWCLGKTTSAIGHFLEAGAVEEAAKAVSVVGGQLVQSGQYDLLGSWINVLPSDLVRADPWLSLWTGAIKRSQGQLDIAQVFLDHALKCFKLNGDRYGVTEARLGLAKVLKSRGEHESALEAIAMAVPRVAARKHDLVPELMVDQSFLQALCGHMETALSSANEALKLAQLFGDHNVLVRVVAGVSQVYFLNGDCTAILRLRRHILRHALSEGQSTAPLDSALAQKEAFALAYRTVGDLDTALDHATRSVEYKNDHGLVEALPCAYWQLGTICADLGELTRAEEALRKAIEIAEVTGGERLYLTLSLAGLSRVRCFEGRLIEAQTLADQGLESAKSLNQSKYLTAVCAVWSLIPRILAGDVETALPVATSAERHLIQYGARCFVALDHAILCFIFDAMGDRKRALAYAERCLTASAKSRYVQDVIALYGIYKPVLRVGLECGIEVGFVQEMLARIGKPALSLMEEMAGHPDPQIKRRAAVPLAHAPNFALEWNTVERAPDGRGVSHESLDDLDDIAASVEPGTLSYVPTAGDHPLLSIRCFGQFRVSAGSRDMLPQEWRTAKSRDLLAYLVHRKEPVQSDEILADLWPDSDPDQSRAVLHTNLYYLRRALQTLVNKRETVVFGGGYYRLAEGCYTTDVDRFETLLSAAQSGDGGEIASPAFLERAIDLYTGDYLQGLDYPWVGSEQRRLRRIYLEAREKLAYYYIKIGSCARALPHAVALAEARPLSEDTHVLVMTAYARLGDLDAVKEQYKRMSRLLDDELGTAPSPQTRKLYYYLCTGQN